MSQGSRPGGLTALAVINLIYGALRLLNQGATAAMAMIPGFPPRGENMDPEQAKGFEQLDALLNWELFWPYIGLELVVTVVLFIAGIGYLKQKRFLGRTLGNVYALLSLGAVALLTIGDPMGMGMSWQSIMGLIYPLLTLFLINTTFKDDLVL